MEWIFNNIYIYFLLITIYCFYWYKGWKAQNRLFKKLKELEKVKSIIDQVNYIKERVPWGSFAINFDNIFDKDDTSEVIILKKQFILSIKKFQIMLLIIIVYFILSTVFSILR